MNISVILSYGIFQNQTNYKGYLDKVLALLTSEKVDKIIICGGFTDNNFPNLSEARSVSNYLLEKNSSLQEKIILEEKSITTLQNIKFASNLISEMTDSNKMITLFCDSIRIIKAYCIGTHLLNEVEEKKEDTLLKLMKQIQEKRIDITKDCELNYKNLLFKGIDMHRTSSEIGDQIPRSVTEIYSLDYSVLEEEAIICRQKEWKIK